MFEIHLINFNPNVQRTLLFIHNSSTSYLVIYIPSSQCIAPLSADPIPLPRTLPSERCRVAVPSPVPVTLATTLYTPTWCSRELARTRPSCAPRPQQLPRPQPTFTPRVRAEARTSAICRRSTRRPRPAPPGHCRTVRRSTRLPRPPEADPRAPCSLLPRTT